MIALPTGASRGLALLLLASVLSALYMLTITPVRDAFTEVDESIGNLRFQLSRYAQIAAAAPALEAEVERLRSRRSLEEDLLTSPSPALAAAAMQQLVSAIVTDSGGTLVSTQALEPEELEDLQAIGMRVVMRGDIEAVQSVLHTIEAGSPVFFVTRLDLHPLDRRTADGRLGQIAPVTLAVDMRIVGYRQLQTSGP